MKPLTYYTDMARASQHSATRLRRRYERLAVVRLVVFFAAVALLVLAFGTAAWIGIASLLLLLGPAVLGLRWHTAIGKEAARSQVQYELAESELRALRYDLSGMADGAQFADPDHPYAADLDVFGPGSLYQFINRTVTAPGAERLAGQLTVPAPHAVAGRRRTAGIALANDPGWCTDFRVAGHELGDTLAQRAQLLEWVSRPPVVTHGPVRAMRWVAPLLALFGGWFCLTQSPWQLGLLAFLPAVVVLRRYGTRFAAEHAYTAESGKVLARYRTLLRLIEERYRPGEHAASAAIGRLSYYASQLDVRYNPFVFLLEISGLWSLQWVTKLDRWRKVHGPALADWLDEIAEVDARISWASLRFNWPDWSEAGLTAERVFVAKGLGHPLLPPSVRVTNDLSLSTDGHIHLVTGSNMAGKSTWLRTVGLNIVLARAGGPVCAQSLRCAPLRVWTSMRTQDKLSESTSSFYAELKRLKSIIEAVADPAQQVFFLLDEILKGTNSRDRHTGSRALIRQLIRERGAGIIATHDLELASLESEAGSRVENYAMEVKTHAGELTFDYKLHRGVSRSFNATALMARMGIEIDPADIKLTHD